MLQTPFYYDFHCDKPITSNGDQQIEKDKNLKNEVWMRLAVGKEKLIGQKAQKNPKQKGECE